jgi:hypothetical protein
MPARVRSAVVAVVGLVLIFLAADSFVRSPAFLNPRDFLEYWSAGAIAARGGNPYDPAALLAHQRLVDPGRDEAVMMWNPPWALALYIPVGLMHPRWATLAWEGLQLAAVMLACDMLWAVYGGAPRRRWLPQVLGLSSAPVAWTVLYGQNTGLLLLGLAGFVFHRTRDEPGRAGLYAALTALKPHLLAVFGLLLVVDVVTRRGRVALLAGGGALLAALGVVLLFTPNIVGQYVEATRNPAPGAVPLSEWVLPVPAYWLRFFLDYDRFWIQFVPCLVVAGGFAAWRLTRGDRWDWADSLPVVVWASVFATAYGGWVFDLTVLLVPLVAGLARGPRPGSLLAGSVCVTAVSLAGVFSLATLVWVAPGLLGLWLGFGLPRGALSPRPTRG